MSLDRLDVYRGRPVLVTGSTGFKGGWLSLWLNELGAKVHGLALPPEEGRPSLFQALRLGEVIDQRFADIRDGEATRAIVEEVRPAIVFHLAAQPLVRLSYRQPVETYETNVMGTVRLLDAVRRAPSVRAVVVVTSDKCYENRESIWGYRESDPLGGSDPYSASKGAAELVTTSFRTSFFNEPHSAAIASARAGNVIGGGDWAEDRLAPDLVRAFARGEPTLIRRPAAVRPWQHVVEPLRGYLLLGAALLGEGRSWAESWNFGPEPSAEVRVERVARMMAEAWGAGSDALRFGAGAGEPRETEMLRLDISKARSRLGWRPALGLAEAVAWTVRWYRAYYERSGSLRQLTLDQIADHTARFSMAESA
jgi:CDP-glucose 4,6-dehydratase